LNEKASDFQIRASAKPNGASEEIRTPDPQIRCLVGAAAIKLSADIVITSLLVIGEARDVLAGMQLGFTPAWVFRCAGAIAKFSVLDDVEVLTFDALPEYLEQDARKQDALGARSTHRHHADRTRAKQERG
jgi:hypothetical protein